MSSNVQFRLKNDTAANWASSTAVTLAAGEPGYDTTNKVLKLGDNSTNWMSLPAVGGPSVFVDVKTLGAIGNGQSNLVDATTMNVAPYNVVIVRNPSLSSKTLTGASGDGNVVTYSYSSSTAPRVGTWVTITGTGVFNLTGKVIASTSTSLRVKSTQTGTYTASSPTARFLVEADWLAIQTACFYSGSSVYIPPGTYQMGNNDLILAGDNITILGAGMSSTILTSTESMSVINFSRSLTNFRMSDIRVQNDYNVSPWLSSSTYVLGDTVVGNRNCVYTSVGSGNTGNILRNGGLASFSTPSKSYACTASFTSGSSTIALSAFATGEDASIGTLVVNQTITFTSPPTGFSASTTYYIISVPSTRSITVSATLGGPAPVTAVATGSAFAILNSPWTPLTVYGAIWCDPCELKDVFFDRVYVTSENAPYFGSHGVNIFTAKPQSITGTTTAGSNQLVALGVGSAGNQGQVFQNLVNSMTNSQAIGGNYGGPLVASGYTITGTSLTISSMLSLTLSNPTLTTVNSLSYAQYTVTNKTSLYVGMNVTVSGYTGATGYNGNGIIQSISGASPPFTIVVSRISSGAPSGGAGTMSAGTTAFLSPGMFVTGTNIPNGTYLLRGSGSSWTLSLPTKGAVTGPLTFSVRSKLSVKGPGIPTGTFLRSANDSSASTYGGTLTLVDLYGNTVNATSANTDAPYVCGFETENVNFNECIFRNIGMMGIQFLDQTQGITRLQCIRINRCNFDGGGLVGAVGNHQSLSIGYADHLEIMNNDFRRCPFPIEFFASFSTIAYNTFRETPQYVSKLTVNAIFIGEGGSGLPASPYGLPSTSISLATPGTTTAYTVASTTGLSNGMTVTVSGLSYTGSNNPNGTGTITAISGNSVTASINSSGSSIMGYTGALMKYNTYVTFASNSLPVGNLAANGVVSCGAFDVANIIKPVGLTGTNLYNYIGYQSIAYVDQDITIPAGAGGTMYKYAVTVLSSPGLSVSGVTGLGTGYIYNWTGGLINTTPKQYGTQKGNRIIGNVSCDATTNPIYFWGENDLVMEGNRWLFEKSLSDRGTSGGTISLSGVNGLRATGETYISTSTSNEIITYEVNSTQLGTDNVSSIRSRDNRFVNCAFDSSQSAVGCIGGTNFDNSISLSGCSFIPFVNAISLATPGTTTAYTVASATKLSIGMTATVSGLSYTGSNNPNGTGTITAISGNIVTTDINSLSSSITSYTGALMTFITRPWTRTISAASTSPPNTQYTVSNASEICPGMVVTVRGIVLSGATGFNGTGTVTAVSGNTVTVSIASTGTPSVSADTSWMTIATPSISASSQLRIVSTSKGTATCNVYAGTTIVKVGAITSGVILAGYRITGTGIPANTYITGASSFNGVQANTTVFLMDSSGAPINASSSSSPSGETYTFFDDAKVATAIA